MAGHNSLQIDRRNWMAAAGFASGVAIASQAWAGMAADEKPWIDAHSHIWSPDVERWPLVAGKSKADLMPPSFTDEELFRVAAPEGVGRVVLIQHSVYHLFDNAYLLDAKRRRPKEFAVVAMVDDHRPDVAERMKQLLPLGATGFRITPFIRAANQDQWLETRGMEAMWRTASQTGQNMCCLIDARHLPGVDAMCAKHPDAPVVIDHFARIGVDGQFREADVANLCRLARHKHVTVKVSAYYALGDKKPPYLDLAPLIRKCLDAYGPERLMWASDSPYQLQNGNDYRSSIALIRDKLDFLSAGDKEWLLRKTAERVFFFQ